MEKRELICINCPMGCPMVVELDGNEIKSISGYACRRGEAYARTEVLDPVRMVCSTVPVMGGQEKLLSVKTQQPIPKDKVFDCVRAMKGLRVSAPMHIGDVVLENVAGTGVNVVATKSV